MGTKIGSIDIGGWNKSQSSILSKFYGDYDNEQVQKNENEINNIFNNYIDNLEINDKKIKIINERINELENLLSKELEINDRHIIGSYARNTIIDSFEGNDVDIMIIMEETIHGEWLIQNNGPSNCLQFIKKIIQKNPKYKDADISIDKNAVTVKYQDFNIDIVPAFKDKIDGYRIPDTHRDQSWIQTNPRMFKKIMSASDKSNNGRISNMVKIVKGWNESNGNILKSYHIETMVYNHFKNRSKEDGKSIYDDVKDIFSRLPWYIRESTFEPVYDEKVDKYLSSSNREKAIGKAQNAINKIEKAEKYKNEGELEKVVTEYKKVLGKKFR